MPNPSPVRTNFIDLIRVLLSFFVVLHHTCIAYGGPGGWYLQEVKTDPDNPLARKELVLFLGVQQAYFMGFFFLLAGYFSRGSLERKGPNQFLIDRLIRLGIPLLVFGFLLGPMTIAIAGIPEGIPFWQNWGQRLTRGQFNHGPLWFAQALLLFSALYVLVAWIIPKGSNPPTPFPGPLPILISIPAVGAFAFLIRWFFPLGTDVWGMQPGYFASYLFLFGFGCRAWGDRWLESIDGKIALPWMVLSLISIPLLPLGLILITGTAGIAGGNHPAAALYAFWEPMVAWGIILGMLWLCRLICESYPGNSPPVKRSIDWLARNSYGMYIVHAPILVGFTVLFWGLPWDPYFKIIVVSCLTTGLSFLLSGMLIQIPGVGKVI